MGNIGSAFDVEKTYRAKNEAFNTSDCLPQFLFNSTNNVLGKSSFGGVKRGGVRDLHTGRTIKGGDLEALILKRQVLLAFVIPSTITLGIGAFLSARPINGRLLEDSNQK
ncbi:hypothetical protein AOQ84DRAFT_363072 [Glonium stellatum]|uniref:Uncharacterized protein n=1 Tax=Glonium stellatum TaxID=574774 RepID=A0A8E2JU76_9PEZI|nr:hypothetical protein AOQ84DRAFT_363072 [Glonium stellatum]